MEIIKTFIDKFNYITSVILIDLFSDLAIKDIQCNVLDSICKIYSDPGFFLYTDFNRYRDFQA